MTSTPEPTDRCITCSDQGLLLRVVRDGDEHGTVLCRRDPDTGGPGSPGAAAPGRDGPAPPDVVVHVDLVDPVRPGDLLLVHAGVALCRLPATTGEAGALDAASGFSFPADHCIDTPRSQ